MLFVFSKIVKMFMGVLCECVRYIVFLVNDGVVELVNLMVVYNCGVLRVILC